MRTTQQHVHYIHIYYIQIIATECSNRITNTACQSVVQMKYETGITASRNALVEQLSLTFVVIYSMIMELRLSPQP